MTPSIIGWSHLRFGKREDTLQEMMAEAARTALADAGLTAQDVDVVHVGVYNNGFSRQGFEAALLGVAAPELAPVPAPRPEHDCATGSTAVLAAPPPGGGTGAAASPGPRARSCGRGCPGGRDRGGRTRPSTG